MTRISDSYGEPRDSNLNDSLTPAERDRLEKFMTTPRQRGEPTLTQAIVVPVEEPMQAELRPGHIPGDDTIDNV